MPTATFVYEGNAIDYTPVEDVSAGDVVIQNDLVGVAKVDIPANTLGALTVTGVFEFPKATGGGESIAAGQFCYWDAGNEIVTTTAGGNTYIGKCVRDAGDDDETVLVRINGQ